MASRKRSISNDADMSAMYKEWDEASCPICMDHPHNAVLLICSSHGKGCRSYICDTSYRHSNCLDRFKKLKEETSDNLSAPNLASENHHNPIDNSTENLDLTTLTNMEKPEEGLDLRCPLCRGIVLGWKVVKEARNYLNLKSRSCSSESCLFSGDYRELRSHARRVHPTIHPADVDPSRQRAWSRLENQREYNDIVSAIQSAMPGAVVLGDYVIDNGERMLSGERDRGGEGGRWLSTLFLFQMMGGSVEPGAERGRPRVPPRHHRANVSFSRRRYLWGERLLGLRNNNENENANDEPELNIVSDLGDDVPRNPRRRRRLTRARSDENRQ
ncbi:hypothetical protein ACJIZ3_011930 [Penstemon smallii]|uniref:Uncharacterized protein n=1 Tax=Penstemon smallii TaxID=265156 RepID=A0ABD3UNQ9_9LAMI